MTNQFKVAQDLKRVLITRESHVTETVFLVTFWHELFTPTSYFKEDQVGYIEAIITALLAAGFEEIETPTGARVYEKREDAANEVR